MLIRITIRIQKNLTSFCHCRIWPILRILRISSCGGGLRSVSALVLTSSISSMLLLGCCLLQAYLTAILQTLPEFVEPHDTAAWRGCLTMLFHRIGQASQQ